MGVLGAGTMAPGIAAAFAGAGHQVAIWSREPGRASTACDRAQQLVRFVAEHDLLPAGVRQDRSPVTVAASLESLEGTDVVVEAIAERVVAKRELLAAVEEVITPSALVATTTSGLRVSEIAQGLARPERVVAMHFWNPAHLMPLVEVGGGRATAPATVDRAMQLAVAIGKQPVRIEREVLGFLGTRMQQAVVREAIALLEAGVASAADIDLAVRTSFGIRFPVTGPLESADLSGLDVIASIHEYLLEDLDRSTAPQAALTSRVAAGQLGTKSAHGFHDWTVRDAGELVGRRDAELVRRLRLLRGHDHEEVTAG
ncbi:MAG: 3-hydroxybutyryl-CoA dehydrogenase [Acidimicrobiales bacterium]|nr:3-hydroxybutyryl-CoA dehydrogenase [Acidimicrobiales bacterium]